jgi:hypothetical protein
MKSTKIVLNHENRLLKNVLKIAILSLLLLMLTIVPGKSIYAHCDSYDGPVIKDAVAALETNNVNLVLKWVSHSQEIEIITLFDKTIKFQDADNEIYTLLKKHFL